MKRSLVKLGFYFIILTPLLSILHATAFEATTPARKYYKVIYQDELFETGLEACKSAPKQLGIHGGIFTDPGFIHPYTCSYSYQSQPYTAPPYYMEFHSAIGPQYICPEGNLSEPTGIYNKIDNGICTCGPAERFFADAISFEKCIRLEELSAAASPAVLPSDNGPGCASEGTPSCGQPINPATGNMWHIEMDYENTDQKSGLALRRIYNSNPFHWDANVGRTFGKRWTQQYDVKIQQEVVNNLDSPQSLSKCYIRYDTSQRFCEPVNQMSPDFKLIPDAVSILRSDGKRHLFNRKGENWLTLADFNDHLVATFNEENTAITGWLFTSKLSGIVEKFDSAGHLISITDRNSLAQRLTYSNGMSNDSNIGRIPIDSPICSNTQIGRILPKGTLLCVTDYAGRQLQFEYDDAGRIVKAIAPGNRITSYEYNGPSAGCTDLNKDSIACFADNLTKVTLPDGNFRTYYYNEASQINLGAKCTGINAPVAGFGHLPNSWTGLVDENGDRHISWTYDCSGRATSSQVGDGAEKVSVNYDGDTSVTYYNGTPDNPTTQKLGWYYNNVLGKRRISSITRPCLDCGNARSLYYDTNGNVSMRDDWYGTRTTYSYDLRRNLEIKRVEGTHNLPRTISTEWHPDFQLKTKISEPKLISKFAYDSKGNLLSKTVQATSDEDGSKGFDAVVIGNPRTWTFSYNSRGQILTIKSPRADVLDVTTYDYDPISGDLISITNAAGHVTSFSNYNPNGLAGTVIAPTGVRTDFEYSVRGLVQAETVTSIDNKSFRTEYTYDGAGQLVSVTHPGQSPIKFEYDSAHRLTGISDGQGNTVRYTLDIMGNRIQEQVRDVSGNLSRQVTRTFDAMKRVQSVTGAQQ